MAAYKEFSSWMTTNRIETLVDGVFAIAMTLLVLELAVPQIGGSLSDMAIQQALYGVLPKFLAFLLSFILLAVFWTINHRHFYQIKRVDSILLWINVIWLLFIVMVPFSESLTGEYGRFTTPHVIFNLNMLGISLFLFLNWYYASKKGFIDEKLDPARITSIKRINLAFILITLMALVLSFIIPGWSSMTYLLIFPVEYLIGRQ
jgi:uncharacterized membrane protein